MTQDRTFRTRALSPEECALTLGRLQLGRLAFTFRDRVDIRPLGYVCQDGWLFGRTALGEKTETLLHHRWVAFQVDEVADLWNWTSVVVHGAFHLLPPDGTGEEARLGARAVEALEARFPGIFSLDDPGRHRTLIFGISIQEMTGVQGVLEGASDPG
jgi:nitroimidazol reductase NimA-like FMN-containing flavoprotein (pyridoxamine 5'-phosphate oxidase superfamily)